MKTDKLRFLFLMALLLPAISLAADMVKVEQA
jgi:hypothetical protein